MFTGIVEAVARIERVERLAELVELRIEVAPELASAVRVGDSVSLSGCCLTVTEVGGARLSFQAVPETLRRSALGERAAGSRLNVERALRADARLDGHIVQGHVDGTGRVRSLRRAGADVIVAVECAPEIAGQLVPKGSVAMDGVSLTVMDVGSDGFEVALIPHTLAVTTLGELREADAVNLEVDVLGKYVRRYLEQVGALPPVR